MILADLLLVVALAAAAGSGDQGDSGRHTLAGVREACSTMSLRCPHVRGACGTGSTVWLGQRDADGIERGWRFVVMHWAMRRYRLPVQGPVATPVCMLVCIVIDEGP